jgi:hypothetical protein
MFPEMIETQKLREPCSQTVETRFFRGHSESLEIVGRDRRLSFSKPESNCQHLMGKKKMDIAAKVHEYWLRQKTTVFPENWVERVRSEYTWMIARSVLILRKACKIRNRQPESRDLLFEGGTVGQTRLFGILWIGSNSNFCSTNRTGFNTRSVSIFFSNPSD